MGSKAERLKRLSREQVEEGILADLISIINEVTDDGRLDTEEIERLNDWLSVKDIEEFPSVAKLRDEISTQVNSAIVDGQGVKNIYKLIERIVPKDYSELISSKRLQRIQDDKIKRQREREEDKESRRKEQELNRSIDSYNFMVAGYHIQENQETIAEEVSENARFSLARERDNPYDGNAILVRANGLKIGYVPRDLAKSMGRQFDDGCSYKIRLVKIIGYKNIVPVMGVSIHDPDTSLEGCRFPESNSYLDEKKTEKRLYGCVGCFTFVIFALFALLVFRIFH